MDSEHLVQQIDRRTNEIVNEEYVNTWEEAYEWEAEFTDDEFVGYIAY